MQLTDDHNNEWAVRNTLRLRCLNLFPNALFSKGVVTPLPRALYPGRAWVGWVGHWPLNHARAHFSTGVHFQLLLCNKTKCLWNENAAAIYFLPLGRWGDKARGGLGITLNTAQNWASIESLAGLGPVTRLSVLFPEHKPGSGLDTLFLWSCRQVAWCIVS